MLQTKKVSFKDDNNIETFTDKRKLMFKKKLSSPNISQKNKHNTLIKKRSAADILSKKKFRRDSDLIKIIPESNFVNRIKHDRDVKKIFPILHNIAMNIFKEMPTYKYPEKNFFDCFINMAEVIYSIIVFNMKTFLLYYIYSLIIFF